MLAAAFHEIGVGQEVKQGRVVVGLQQPERDGVDGFVDFVLLALEVGDIIIGIGIVGGLLLNLAQVLQRLVIFF